MKLHVAALVGLMSCAPQLQQQVEPPMSAEEHAAISRYGDTTPFVLGEGMSTYGAEDPLEMFAMFPSYGGHFLSATQPQTMKFLYKRGATDVSELRTEIGIAACPTIACRETVTGIETERSLRDVRSIADWVTRSPVKNLSWTTVLSEEGAFIEFSVTSDRIEVVEQLLSASAAPAEAWRVTLARRYEAN